MFDPPGIGIEDLPWIHRDQFVHYTQLAYVLSDPNDWPRLRQDLLRALTAAFGLDVGDVNGEHQTRRQRRALKVIDGIRRHHDPAKEWPTFFDTLWSQRHAIRPDLP
jgi:hypothetical protein